MTAHATGNLSRFHILEVIATGDRPSLQDVGDVVGLTPAGVLKHVRLLEAEGLVRCNPGHARSLVAP
jgi:predicted ArsR family transcriptional regulator